MDHRLKMYEALTCTPGISGYEGLVRRVMQTYLEPLSDEMMTDNLGSIVGRKSGRASGPRIVVAGHLDEVGWMVTQVTPKGFLKIQPVGAWWSQTMLAQRVRIYTRKGELLGLVGAKPWMLMPEADRQKPVAIKDMFVDIGASSSQEALELGVRPGDQVVPYCDFTVMPNPKILLNKAWDNRAGCAAAIMTLEELAGQDHPNTVYAVGTVQEEMSMSGAVTVSHMVEPDIGIALDVTIANDLPGIGESEIQAKMGGGPVLLLYEAGGPPSQPLLHLAMDTADEIGIAYQCDVTPGSTDARMIQRWGRGVPSIAICFATRYIHTHAALIHRDDIENAAKLTAAIIRRLDDRMVQKIKENHL